MAPESTDVYKYLVYLRKNLLGDLDLFHKLTTEADIEESRIRDSSSETPEVTTTQYPYSFEFMFGTPLISRSTIPHTSVLFSTIDILGFLNRTEPSYRQTTENFKKFFESVTPEIDGDKLSVLIKAYRHGMTHSYFPKLGVVISYHSSNPTGKIIFKNERSDLVLNVNALETTVTKRLSDLMSDSGLYSNMDNQYRILVDGYERECRTEIDALKTRL
jgi:hypothetical protein